MFFTSRKHYLSKDTREINLDQNSGLPSLYRLKHEFGLVTIAINNRSATPKHYAVCEVSLGNPSAKANPITPKFDSLAQLEEHVSANLLEILNQYLFGGEEQQVIPQSG